MADALKDPKDQLLELIDQWKREYEQKNWPEHVAIMDHFADLIRTTARSHHCLLMLKHHCFDSLQAQAFLHPTDAQLNHKIVDAFFLSMMHKLKTKPGTALPIALVHNEVRLILHRWQDAVEVMFKPSALEANHYAETHSLFAKQRPSSDEDVNVSVSRRQLKN